MYDCIPLFVPSNLGETKLFINIEPGLNENEPNISEITGMNKGQDETYRFEGHSCFVRDNTVAKAQQTVIRLSKQLEKHPYHSIQSDRLYFLPLFAGVGYDINVETAKHYARPIIRIGYCQEDLTWTCKIYASNLIQLQEALFSHERNLLKKRLQVLNQRRAKTWESGLT